jgi:hypothetical protein
MGQMELLFIFIFESLQTPEHTHSKPQHCANEYSPQPNGAQEYDGPVERARFPRSGFSPVDAELMSGSIV